MDYYDSDITKILDAKKIEMILDDVKYIMYCVLSGVNFLHENYYIHRDVKPSNFVVNYRGEIALIDFGLSRKFASPNKELTKNVITRWYKPPEILYGARFYGEKVDVWSCGCIFAEVFLGEPLFPGTSDIDQLSRIFGIRGTPNTNNWPDVVKLPNYFAFEDRNELPLQKILLKADEESLYWIDKMLKLDPNQRPSLNEVLSSKLFSSKYANQKAFAEKIKPFLGNLN